MDRALASSICSKEHLAVFYDMIDDRLAQLDMSVILMNLVDTAPAEALPYLAKQFGITGYSGWLFMVTDSQKRELIKKAYLLRGRSGTPWSIKEALRIAGFEYVTFQEGIDKLLDGTWDLDGTYTLGQDGWANFKAIILVDDPNGVLASTITLITAIINEYKPVRSHLLEIIFDLIPAEFLFTVDQDTYTVDSTLLTADKTLK